MTRRLKSSPLPARIEPEPPLRDWLWSEAGLYDGVLLPSSEGTDNLLRALLPQARDILAIESGVCLIFAAPQTLDPAQLGTALPLRDVGTGSVSSYDLANSGQSAGRKTLHLVRNGERLRVSLENAKRFEALDFWDFSDLRVVPSHTIRSANPWGEAEPVAASVGNNPEVAALVGAEPTFKEMREKLGDDYATPRRGWFSNLFQKRTIGPQSGGGPGRPGSGAGGTGIGEGFAQPKGPGALTRMAEWLLWKTPAGNNLRKQMERHMDDVSQMIERGDIDAALRKAISLSQKKKEEDARMKRQPLSMPKDRASLDFDLSGVDLPTSSILSSVGYDDLRQQYIALAKKLSEDGDHRRAAFIYAELLDDVQSALNELEAMKAFEEAAKLALARKRPAEEFIRLFFLADKKDVALAFAKRHGMLEFLSNVSFAKDAAFAHFVRLHWIEALYSAGDLTRAIVESAGMPELVERRREWIEQAVMLGGLSEPVILCEATLALDWSPDALGREPVRGGEDAASLVTQRLYHVLNDIEGGMADGAQDCAALVSSLIAARQSGGFTTKDFWTSRAPALADRLIRTSLARGEGAADLKLLKRFASDMSLRVMLEDLRHVVRGSRKIGRTRRQLKLPPARPNATLWSGVVCLPNDRVLLSSPGGEIAQIDESGRRLWTDHLTDLVAVVPVGVGRLVLIIQGTTSARKVAVLDTATHIYRPLGLIDLVAWHDAASAASWMVQSSKAVLSLDMVALLSDAARVESLWSITQTVPLRVVCFLETARDFAWVSQRDHEGAPGLLELWLMPKGEMAIATSLLPPLVRPEGDLYTAPFILDSGKRFYPQRRAVTAESQPLQPLATNARTYSYDVEKSMMQDHTPALIALEGRFAEIVSNGDQQIICTSSPDTDSADAALWNHNGSYLHLNGSGIRAQSAQQSGARAAVVDDAGRVIIADPVRRRLTCVQV